MGKESDMEREEGGIERREGGRVCRRMGKGERMRSTEAQDA